MAAFTGFQIRANPCDSTVTVMFGNPPDVEVTIPADGAGALGERLVEAAGFLLLGEAPPDTWIQEPEPPAAVA